MSIYGALNSAVSGLHAQSQSLAMISDNISNSGTVGYKTSSASFSSLVTEQRLTWDYASGGVISRPRQNVSQQGLIEATSSSTDLAIDGKGFFVVTDSLDPTRSGYSYTRAGEFRPDAQGYLTNSSGMYLQGIPVDRNGAALSANTSNVTSLEPVNVYRASGSAAATTNVGMKVNLPAEAAVGDSFASSVEVFDSLGASHNLELQWQKSGANQWTLDFSDPTASGDPSTVTGTVASGPVTIDFNSDGTLASTIPSPPDVQITGWTTGAANSSIALDLGSIGGSDGLSQFSSGSSTPKLSVSWVEQDGSQFGSFVNASVGEDGLVHAHFDNGETWPIYRIPVATFANPDGLAATSGNAYVATPRSGDYLLNSPGTGGAGRVVSSAVETSTVDLADEFSRMIKAQEAYSAASKVLSTADEMLQELLNATR